MNGDPLTVVCTVDDPLGRTESPRKIVLSMPWKLFRSHFVSPPKFLSEIRFHHRVHVPVPCSGVSTGMTIDF